jgi:porin
LGVAAAVAGDEFEEASEAEGTPLNGAEVAIELTYRMQLTPWLAVQPDIQYIVDPGFDEDVGNALALGTRVEVAF